MSTPFLFFLMSLVVFRVSWLISKDDFPPTRRLRELAYDVRDRKAKQVVVDEDNLKDDHGSYQGYRGIYSWPADLLECYWCTSVWASAGVTFLMHLIYPLSFPLLWFGGVAGMAAIIATVVYKLTE